MSQRTHGIYKILSSSGPYDLLQNMLGANSSRKSFVKDYVKPKEGDSVLDIGCGTGVLLDFMPDVRFVGYDLNPQYIEAAKKMYGDRAEFYTDDVRELELSPDKKFDIVISVGVMHHLDDEDAANLVRIAHSVLKQGGRLITIDPAFEKNQKFVSRFLINRDRGLNVRNEEDALKLYQPLFPNVRSNIRHNLLRVPYTHLIMEATRE